MGSGLFAAAGWVAEKELSIGVGIARFVEDRLAEVSALTVSAPGKPLRSVSADAGKLSNLAGDAVRAMARFFADGLGGIVGFELKPTVPRTPDSVEAPAVLQIPGPLFPGQTGERVLLFDNESAGPTGEFALASSDLLCASGTRISADCVRFEPATLSVPARGRRRIVVGVTVPRDTPSGSYAGLLQGAGLEHYGRLIRVDVA